MTFPPVPSVEKMIHNGSPALPPVVGVMVLPVFEVQAIVRTLGLDVLIVSVIAALNVAALAAKIAFEPAARLKPGIALLAAIIVPVISPVPGVTVGVPKRLSFEKVIGSLALGKIKPGVTFDMVLLV